MRNTNWTACFFYFKNPKICSILFSFGRFLIQRNSGREAKKGEGGVNCKHSTIRFMSPQAAAPPRKATTTNSDFVIKKKVPLL